MHQLPPLEGEQKPPGSEKVIELTYLWLKKNWAQFSKFRENLLPKEAMKKLSTEWQAQIRVNVLFTAISKDSLTLSHSSMPQSVFDSFSKTSKRQKKLLVKLEKLKQMKTWGFTLMTLRCKMERL